MRKDWLAAAIAFGVALGFAVAASAKTPIDRTVKVSATVEVQIENIAGSVEVTAWDKNEVHIGGMLGDHVAELEVDLEDDDELEINVIMPRRAQNVEDTDLIIQVPKGASVEIETVSAAVTVAGTRGELKVESVSGEVRLSGTPESVEVESVSGRIVVTGSRESVEAETVSGTIDVKECSGELDLSTTSGPIDVGNGNYDSVECSSVSGNIRFEADNVRRGEFDLENFSGSIDLKLPANVSAEFDVETFSGEIRSEFGGSVQTEDYGPGASLSTTTGSGAAKFSISSFSGAIRIEKR